MGRRLDVRTAAMREDKFLAQWRLCPDEQTIETTGTLHLVAHPEWTNKFPAKFSHALTVTKVRTVVTYCGKAHSRLEIYIINWYLYWLLNISAQKKTKSRQLLGLCPHLPLDPTGRLVSPVSSEEYNLTYYWNAVIGAQQYSNSWCYPSISLSFRYCKPQRLNLTVSFESTSADASLNRHLWRAADGKSDRPNESYEPISRLQNQYYLDMGRQYQVAFRLPVYELSHKHCRRRLS